jgi:hypothetical protein
MRKLATALTSILLMSSLSTPGRAEISATEVIKKIDGGDADTLSAIRY